jgi:hypothetical protein
MPGLTRCLIYQPAPPQASLRDADHMDGQPGDKSPGYYRVSLRDEMKRGSQNTSNSLEL